MAKKKSAKKEKIIPPTVSIPKTLVRSPRGFERREVPLDEVVVPDLWHIIEDKAIPAGRREAIRECWRLCHDLLEHARGV